MDDDSVVSRSKVTTETANKVKDGYVQLAEKMEQVRTQMAKMERKYDELYQTVKEREHGKSEREYVKTERELGKSVSVTPDQMSPEEGKTPRESVVEASSSAKQSITSESSVSPSAIPEKPSPEEPKPNDMDIEKLEDNPFV